MKSYIAALIIASAYAINLKAFENGMPMVDPMPEAPMEPMAPMEHHDDDGSMHMGDDMDKSMRQGGPGKKGGKGGPGKKGGKGEHGEHSDHGEGDKMLMEHVIKPMAKMHGITKEQVAKVGEMTDEQRDIWCMEGERADFCRDVKEGIEGFIKSHEKKSMIDMIKPLAEEHGVDMETVNKVHDMTEEDRDIWCMEHADFCAKV